MEHTDNKRKYSKISYQKRLKLIDMVEKQQIGVTRAAKKLRIKIPTAKVILSSFRKKGVVFLKASDKKRISEPVPQIQQVQELKCDDQAIVSASALMPICFYPPIFYSCYQIQNCLIIY